MGTHRTTALFSPEPCNIYLFLPARFPVIIHPWGLLCSTFQTTSLVQRILFPFMSGSQLAQAFCNSAFAACHFSHVLYASASCTLCAILCQPIWSTLLVTSCWEEPNAAAILLKVHIQNPNVSQFQLNQARSYEIIVLMPSPDQTLMPLCHFMEVL